MPPEGQEGRGEAGKQWAKPLWRGNYWRRASEGMGDQVMHEGARWFSDLRFGVFVHWGLYSIAARGEWLMMIERWSNEEYAELVKEFHPREDAARLWVDAASQAQAEYMVMTTRHHDGFCLFDSSVSEFSSVNSPAKRDYVADYVRACRNAGMKVGLYYSLADWRIPTHRGDELIPENMERLRTQVREQVRELLTNYGKIDILWYDGAFSYNEKGIRWGGDNADWKTGEVNALARKLQPGIAINNRSGTPEDFSTPEQHIQAAEPGRAWEACMTMNDSWGYHAGDHNWKAPYELIHNIVTCSSGGGSYLLNIGPKADGSVPEESKDRLRVIGEWLRAYGGTIHGAEGVATPCGFPMMRKGNTLYLHQFLWRGPEMRFTHCPGTVRRAWLVKSGAEAQFTQNGDVVFLSGLPEAPEDPVDTVIAVELA